MNKTVVCDCALIKVQDKKQNSTITIYIRDGIYKELDNFRIIKRAGEIIQGVTPTVVQLESHGL